MRRKLGETLLIEHKVRWVRVGQAQWEAVDAETGLSTRTGLPVVEWKRERDAELKVTRRSSPKLKKEATKIRPESWVRAVIESSEIEAPWPNDPNAEEWCKRDFFEAYNWARVMYIQNAASLPFIASKTGFSVRRLRFYANDNTKERVGWKVDRKTYQNAVIRQVVKDTKERCSELMTSLMDVVEKQVVKLRNSADEGDTLKASEVKSLVSAIKEVYEISQLESGDPTKIVQNVRLSRDDILKKLKEADPLVNYEEVVDEQDTKSKAH